MEFQDVSTQNMQDVQSVGDAQYTQEAQYKNSLRSLVKLRNYSLWGLIFAWGAVVFSFIELIVSVSYGAALIIFQGKFTDFSGFDMSGIGQQGGDISPLKPSLSVAFWGGLSLSFLIGCSIAVFVFIILCLVTVCGMRRSYRGNYEGLIVLVALSFVFAPIALTILFIMVNERVHSTTQMTPGTNGSDEVRFVSQPQEVRS